MVERESLTIATHRGFHPVPFGYVNLMSRSLGLVTSHLPPLLIVAVLRSGRVKKKKKKKKKTEPDSL